MVLLCFGIMAPGKAGRPVKKAGADKARMKRFLYLWIPIICLVVIGAYALSPRSSETDREGHERQCNADQEIE